MLWSSGGAYSRLDLHGRAQFHRKRHKAANHYDHNNQSHCKRYSQPASSPSHTSHSARCAVVFFAGNRSLSSTGGYVISVAE